MTIAEGEYKSVVGVSDLYYATITADSDAAFTPGTPKYLAPLAEISQEPSTSSETQYMDNIPYDVGFSEGETKVNITISNLPLETQAELLGKVWDATNHMMYDNGGLPPYVSLMFKSLKSTGKSRYFCFLKGRFELPKEKASTKADKVSFGTVELTFTAIFTTHKFALSATVTDHVKRTLLDEDVSGSDGSDWFTTVPVPAYTEPAG